MSNAIRLHSPLKNDNDMPFYPITTYDQIILPDCSRWNGRTSTAMSINGVAPDAHGNVTLTADNFPGGIKLTNENNESNEEKHRFRTEILWNDGSTYSEGNAVYFNYELDKFYTFLGKIAEYNINSAQIEIVEQEVRIVFQAYGMPTLGNLEFLRVELTTELGSNVATISSILKYKQTSGGVHSLENASVTLGPIYGLTLA